MKVILISANPWTQIPMRLKHWAESNLESGTYVVSYEIKLDAFEYSKLGSSVIGQWPQ